MRRAHKDDAESNENEGEQDVFPAPEHLRDRLTGGEELGGEDEHGDQGQEDDRVGDHGAGAHG